MSTSAPVASEGQAKDRLVADSLIYLAGRLIPAALAITSVPLFARALGAEAYGTYALYAALALTSGNAAGAWMGQAVLRFASRIERWGGQTLDRTLGRAGLVVAMVAGVAAAAGGGLLPWDPGAWASSVALAASLAVYAVASARAQAALQPVRVSIVEAVRVGVSVAGPALAIFGLGSRSPDVPLLGAAAGNIVGTVLMLPSLPSVARPGWRSRVALRRMMLFGAPLAGWMLVSTVLNLSDRYIIEVLLGPAEVGAYAAVYDIVFKGIVFVSTPMLLAAHPMIMSAWNRGDEGAARHILRRTLMYAVGTGVAATALVWVVAPVVFPYVLGDVASEGAVRASAPIAAGAFLWQIAMLVHKPLEIDQRTPIMLIMVVVALFVNVLLNVVLIPHIGVIAAGYATVCGALVYLVLVIVMVGRSSRA